MCDNPSLSYWRGFCASGFLLSGTLPAINPTTGKGMYASGGAIPTDSREASYWMENFGLQGKFFTRTTASI